MTRRPTTPKMTPEVTPEQLREVQEAFERLHPSSGLTQRLHTSLQARARPRRADPWRWPAVAGALAVGVALGWVLRAPPSAPASPHVAGDPTPRPTMPPSSAQPPEGPQVLSSACTLESRDDALHVPGGCRLRWPTLGVTLDAWAPTTLGRTPSGLAMGEGLAAFDVDPVAAGRSPIEIDVGPAVVRVVGTRFVITNATHAGHLDLIEGAVELALVHEERVVTVAPGRRASWTREGTVVPAERELPSEPETETELDPETGPDPKTEREPDPEPTPSTTPAPERSATTNPTARRPVESPASDASAQLRAVLADVARLRRQHEYEQALTRLDSLSTRSWDRSTRAVLSYERGTLLEAAGRTDDACAHWTRHHARFGGQGPTDVQARRARLRCDR